MSQTFLSLQSLPPEVLTAICEHLPLADLASLVRTSTLFAWSGTPQLYDALLLEDSGTTANPAQYLSRSHSRFISDYFHKRAERLLATQRFSDGRGKTILHHLGQSGNRYLLDILLAKGADISVRDHDGLTPFHEALCEGKEDFASRLMDVGADILTPAQDKVTLAFANADASEGLLNRIFAAIQAAGGDPFCHGPDGHTALHHASRRGNWRLVKFLVASGADVFTTNRYGHTPLVYSTIHMYSDTSKILLDAMESDYRGYDINTPLAPLNDDGFETSVREAYPGTVRVLCDLYKHGKVKLDLSAAAQIMVSTCDYYGMHVRDQDINDTLYYLIDAGANVNARSGSGDTCLHQLCTWEDEHQEARLQLVRYLLDHGADWRLRDRDGNTIFHKALTADQLQHFICLLLYGAGFDPNAVNDQGQTLAHVAIGPLVSRELLDYLSSLGVDLSGRDNEDNPPIHYVATHRWLRGEVREEAIRYLVEKKESLHPGCSKCEAAIGEVYREGGFLL
ncbi:ankyrin [Aspergillus heterothallicus]